MENSERRSLSQVPSQPDRATSDINHHTSTAATRDLPQPDGAGPASHWPRSKKWTAILTTCLICFVVGINSTAILSATDAVSEDFHISLEKFDYSFFLVTAWNTGAAIVPLVLLPLMEDFGVRPIYLSLYVLFVIFVVVQAVAPNFATLLVARAISGSCGGALQNAVDGMAADIWGEDSERKALSLTIFIFALLGGVTIGPVIGGAIITSLGWRWIMYIQLMIYGAAFPVLYFGLHETRPLSSSQKDQPSFQQRMKTALNETVLRSSRMLFTEFVLASFTLWSAFAFGTVFIMTQSIPLVYNTLYGWEPWQTGIVQASILIGELVGAGLCIFQDLVIFPRYGRRTSKALRKMHQGTHGHNGGNNSDELDAHTRPSSDTHIHTDTDTDIDIDIDIDADTDVEATSRKETPSPRPSTTSSTTSPTKPPSNPEARLYTAIPGSLLGLTAGFFIYSATTDPNHTHSWILPSFSLFLIGLGIQVIVQSVTTYITDFYPHHANSAVSAIAFGENFFAAFLPLSTRDMYSALGFGWASRLLGFAAVVLCCVPAWMAFLGGGPWLRRRSKFTLS